MWTLTPPCRVEIQPDGTGPTLLDTIYLPKVWWSRWLQPRFAVLVCRVPIGSTIGTCEYVITPWHWLATLVAYWLLGTLSATQSVSVTCYVSSIALKEEGSPREL